MTLMYYTDLYDFLENPNRMQQIILSERENAPPQMQYELQFQ